jgi:hypothetical protein
MKLAVDVFAVMQIRLGMTHLSAELEISPSICCLIQTITLSYFVLSRGTLMAFLGK